ncbi:MAG: 6-phosphogluconolactonase [Phycisphaeraceae bacterium]|nr:6-phosphogluconolactonase [Phycisphaeraceae bacterium]
MALFGETVVEAELEELFEALGRELGYAMHSAVNARQVCHIALSGGSTPEPFYMRLVTDPLFRGLPWDSVHVWMVDERRVSETDPRNNFKMIRECLVDHVPIKRRSIHPMPVLTADPAAAYEQEMRDHIVIRENDAFNFRGPRFDFLLLGIGQDAHTASLFPGSSALDVADRWITVNEGPRVTPPPRLTMTYPLINAARQVAVLATGADKSQVIAQVRNAGKPDPRKLPITGVRPNNGAMIWFLDEAAAGVTPQESPGSP